jgi:hypothetical protein
MNTNAAVTETTSRVILVRLAGRSLGVATSNIVTKAKVTNQRIVVFKLAADHKPKR